MENKKEYRSAVRSRRLIREAFMRLLETKEFSKITVTDVVKEADLNRSTFYAHYPDIYGVYEELMEEIISRCVGTLDQLGFANLLTEPMGYINTISAALEEYDYLYRKLGHSGEIHRVLDVFRQRIARDVMSSPQIPEKTRTAPFFAIRIHFFVGGIMNTYQQWLEGKLNCSLEEVNREICDLITKTAVDVIGTDYIA